MATAKTKTKSKAVPSRAKDVAGTNKKREDGYSKMDAVKAAMKDLGGKEAMPGQIREHLAAAGIKMTAGLVSNYKSIILRKKGSKKKDKAGVVWQVSYNVDNSRARARPTTGIEIGDILAVKELAARIGGKTFLELTDALTK